MEPLAVPANVLARNMYDREVNIMSGLCLSPPMGCGRTISPVELREWDQATFNEYRISGWCNKCQDKIFVDPDEPDCCCINPCTEADVGVGVITCATVHCACGDDYDTNFADRIYEADFEEYWKGVPLDV